MRKTDILEVYKAIADEYKETNQTRVHTSKKNHFAIMCRHGICSSKTTSDAIYEQCKRAERLVIATDPQEGDIYVLPAIKCFIENIEKERAEKEASLKPKRPYRRSVEDDAPIAVEPYIALRLCDMSDETPALSSPHSEERLDTAFIPESEFH